MTLPGKTAGPLVDHSQEILAGVATRHDLHALETKIDHSVALLGTELKWIKIIGGTIVCLLVLPWLVGLAGATLPGP